MDLQDPVFEFAQLAIGLHDPDLDRPWKWNDYEEGIRFAFFRVYEELRSLAATVLAERQQSGQPQTHAQRILAQYHAAFLDLDCLLLGTDETRSRQRPEQDAWPLHTTLVHIVDAERSFLAINQYTLERERSADGRPLAMSDEAWETFWAGDPFPTLAETGSFAELQAYYLTLHQRVMTAFVSVTQDELRAPAVFWESEPMPLQFRLHRFDSHLRQHTIQTEKILAAIAPAPSEARRLLRLIYNALAEAEGSRLGAGLIGSEHEQHTARAIAAVTVEFRSLLQP